MNQGNRKGRRGQNDIFTYRRIRRAIGYLGLLLPVILVILSLFRFFDTSLQPSISDYYYTNFREILTGTLSAVGVFLIRYKGHDNESFFKNDQLLTNIAGIMALGVALIPVNPAPGQEKLYTLIPYDLYWLGWLHYGFAAGLFGIFALLALNVFTIGQEQNEEIPVSRLNENHIYRFCGIGIIVCMLLVPVSEKFKLFENSTLVLEAVMLFLFGAAWLIKGRALGDEGKLGEKLYREHNNKNTEEAVEN
ncbi:hypothetical protein FHG64_05610 [Antarcticibacterium flavum]|uniref:DUF998 domain-containing protein n=1 Tax=Antarcticibacterium flavum TaxID=2058175 RepID=A0A5B7X0Y4_9FLAO|nr:MULTISPECIES: hypothetical protein [Antarcticibacterium]MCM4159922.1 hypothetical protein [Antarcticibacterium sp. W02-3]QCY68920.1 hypothetical protein FHG64_05610 [Antarcticibacterium flavum]